MWGLLLTLACLQVAVLADGEDKVAKRIHAVSQDKTNKDGYPGDSLDTADINTSVSAPVLAPRIVGGKEADVGEWPWQVMILRFRDSVAEYYFECGGSLIGRQWVLTTASCLDKSKNYPSHYLAVLGAHHKNLSLGNHAFVPVGAILVHPDLVLKLDSRQNDIALVKLGLEVTTMAPIRMPAEGEAPPSTEKCVVTGWGDTKGTGDSILQEAYVNIVPIAQCTQWWGHLPDRVMCAGYPDGSGAVCYGDGGGPLVCNMTLGSTTRYTQFGIASFNVEDCTRIQRPAVYTDVTKYSTWIKSTKDNSPDISVCFDRTTIRTCGTTITANNTVFRSPVTSYSTWVYPNNVDCSWTIRAPMGYVVRFKFLCFFSTEATSIGSTCRNDDYLKITNTSGRVQQFCGSHVIEKLDAYETDGNEAILTFHSNSALIAQGFVVRAEFVKKYPEMCFDRATIQTCDSTIISNNTIFRSPVASSSKWTYPANADCSWTIRAPIGYVVRFEFLCFFSTETTSKCSNDYLQITNTSGRSFRYCGAHAIEKLNAYETDGNEATLTFHSNSAVTGQGFVVRADFVKKYPDMCFDRATIRTCGSTILTNNTIFRSPVTSSSNWTYPANVDCSWTLRAPIGYVVRFEFLCFFNTEATSIGSTCRYDDYLQITNTSGRNIRYCGAHAFEKLDAYETDGNKATLTFHSNSRLTAQGFVVQADFVKKYPFSSADLPAFNMALILVGLFASIITSG